MQFSLFSPFLFIITVLNFSVDSVQHDRFRKERKRHMRSRASDCATNSPDAINELLLTQKPQRERDRRRGWRRLWCLYDDVRWMLEYNQNGLLHLLIGVTHIWLIAFQISKSLLYSTLPSERDPLTNRFKHPVLDCLESMYVIDPVIKYDPSGVLDRLIAMFFSQYLLVRIRAFYIRLKTAKTNRFTYTKINIVNMDISYATAWSADTVGWSQFLNHAYYFRCDSCSQLRREWGKMMKELSRRVRKLSRIDRVYFFNQIDHEPCFAGQKILKTYHRTNTMEAATAVAASASGPDAVELRQEEDEEVQVTWRRKLNNLWTFVSSIDLPGKRCYVSKPIHRIDPRHVFFLGISNALLTIFMAIVVGTMLTGFILSEMTYYGLEFSNLTGTFGTAAKNMLSDFRAVMALLQVVASHLIVAVNTYENSLLFYSSGICHSRSAKVVKMIRLELEFHYHHIRAVQLYVERRDIVFAPNTRASFARPDQLTRRRNLSTVEFMQATSPAYARATTAIGRVSSENVEFGDESFAAFEAAISDYKQNIDKQDLEEFNDNINHLLDLVEVLQEELNDLKTFFTFFLNTNVVYGTVGSAVILALVVGSQDHLKTLVLVGMSIATLASLVNTLAVGAISEGAFRRIYRSLLPLMINELGLVDEDVAHRMRKICEHIAKIDKRSFILLGNLPLTFGTMASILGWSATGNLFLMRFLEDDSMRH